MNMHMTPHPRLYLAFDAFVAARDKPEKAELADRIIRAVEQDQFSDFMRTSSSARWAVASISSVVVLAVLDFCTWIARFH